MKKAGMSNAVFIGKSRPGRQDRFSVKIYAITCPAGLDNTHAGSFTTGWKDKMMSAIPGIDISLYVQRFICRIIHPNMTFDLFTIVVFRKKKRKGVTQQVH
jgi:hypothetical protein